MKRQPDVGFTALPPHGKPVIKIDDGVRFQRFQGVGGAMTDTSAWLMWRLPARKREALMQRLFGTQGIHLGFVRVPIAASDFTAHGKPYSYDDGPPDPQLKHFSISHDKPYILPALRRARALNSGLQLLASPWSPPPWMKTNDAFNNIGGNGRLRSSAYRPLASYFVRFLKAYAAAGVPVDAVTPQNQPGVQTTYPGMELSAGAESAFVAGSLVPALAQAHLHPSIFGLDHVWAASSFAGQVASGSAGKYLRGLAWHCYVGSPASMAQLHATFPNLAVRLTECSPPKRKSVAEVELASLRNWAGSVALWNLALNAQGGPVEPPNSGCHGCTGIVTISGGRVRYMLAYYQLGQVSKFVAPGATRIASNHFVSYSSADNPASPGLDDVAFRNPDGSHVLIAYNNSSHRIGFAVTWQKLWFTYSLPAHGMATFTW